MYPQIGQGLEMASQYKQQELGNIPKRESAGTQVMFQLGQLVDQAQKLAFLLDDRLTPITSGKSEEDEKLNKQPTPVNNLPPMFEEIRSRLWSIENSLKSIEETITRVEL